MQALYEHIKKDLSLRSDVLGISLREINVLLKKLDSTQVELSEKSTLGDLVRLVENLKQPAELLQKDKKQELPANFFSAPSASAASSNNVNGTSPRSTLTTSSSNGSFSAAPPASPRSTLITNGSNGLVAASPVVPSNSGMSSRSSVNAPMNSVTDAQASIKKNIADLKALFPKLVEVNTKSFGVPVKTIIEVYENFLTEWQTANLNRRMELEEIPVSVILQSGELCLTTQTLAREFIRRDSLGGAVKKNASGTHAVRITKDTVAKASVSGERDLIHPWMEALIVNLSNGLARKLSSTEDADITAPMTVLYLDSVMFNVVQENLTDKAALLAFSADRKLGEAPDALLAKHPNVVVYPQKKEAIIQVATKIPDWSGADFLGLLQYFDQALIALDEEQLANFLSLIFQDKLLSAFLARDPANQNFLDTTAGFTPEKQIEGIFDYFLWLSMGVADRKSVLKDFARLSMGESVALKFMQDFKNSDSYRNALQDFKCNSNSQTISDSQFESMLDHFLWLSAGLVEPIEIAKNFSSLQIPNKEGFAGCRQLPTYIQCLQDFKSAAFVKYKGTNSYVTELSVFKQTYSKYSRRELLNVLEMIMQYPVLQKGHDFSDVLNMFKLFRDIPELFPENTPIPTIMQELPNFLNLLDDENFAIWIISALLFRPGDLKADNIKFVFVRNALRKITNIIIKGIDNDVALVRSIILYVERYCVVPVSLDFSNFNMTPEQVVDYVTTILQPQLRAINRVVKIGLVGGTPFVIHVRVNSSLPEVEQQVKDEITSVINSIPIIFGKPTIVKEANHTVAVKCILYCLSVMQRKFNPLVAEKFKALSKEVFFLEQLGQQYRHEQAYDQFGPFKSEVGLPGLLNPNSFRLIYSIWQRMQENLSSDLTYAQLLEIVEPHIGKMYKQVSQEEIYPNKANSRIYHGKEGEEHSPLIEDTLPDQVLDGEFVEPYKVIPPKPNSNDVDMVQFASLGNNNSLYLQCAVPTADFLNKVYSGQTIYLLVNNHYYLVIVKFDEAAVQANLQLKTISVAMEINNEIQQSRPMLQPRLQYQFQIALPGPNNTAVFLPQLYNVEFTSKQMSLRVAAQVYKGNDRFEEDQTQSLTETIQDLLEVIAIDRFYQSELIWPMLHAIFHFDFVSKLPFSDSQLNNLLYKAILRGEAGVVSVLLRCGAKVNVIFDKNYGEYDDYSPLQLAVVQKPPSLPVIQVLLQSKGIKPNRFNKKGDTALLLADIENDQLIKTLVENGVDIDLSQVLSNETVLLRAINQDCPDLFLKLIKLGAGTNIDPAIALNFINRYRSQSAWQASMTEALKTLMNQNGDFELLVCLEAFTQKDNVNAALPIDWINFSNTRERRYIRPECVSAIFDESGKIRRTNLFGKRNVAIVTVKDPLDASIEYKLCLKDSPELFMTSRMVKLLADMLFPRAGILTSNTALIFYNKQGEPYPVSLTPFARGNNLQTALEKTDGINEKTLDQKSFSMSTVIAVLVKYTDEKADNDKVQKFINKFGEEKDRIACFDYEAAFFPSMIKVKDKNGQMKNKFQFKSIQFCMDVMRYWGVHPEVRSAILSVQPDVFFEKWLKAFANIQKAYDGIFSQQSRMALAKNNVFTRSPLPPGFMGTMYTTLVQMQLAFTNPNMSLIEFAISVDHSCVNYLKVLQNPDLKTSGARFDHLFKGDYSKESTDYMKSTATPGSLYESASVPVETAMLDQETYGPAHNLKELEAAVKSSEDLTTAYSALLKGDSKPLSNLFPTFQRKVLAKVPFRTLPAEQRTSVLLALEKVSLEVLALNHLPSKETDTFSIEKELSDTNASSGNAVEESRFDNVTRELISPILQISSGLRKLDLSGCRKLPQSIIADIVKCRVLECLYLNNLPLITGIFSVKKGKILAFLRLQILEVGGCSLLSQVEIFAPNLKKLSVDRNPKLEKLKVGGRSLIFVNAKGSRDVHKDDLLQLLAQNAQLLYDVSRFKSEIVIDPLSLLYFCLPYGIANLTTSSVDFVTAGAKLNLKNMGHLTNQNFNSFILKMKAYVNTLNIVGCDLINSQSLSSLLAKMTGKKLTSIVRTNFYKPMVRQELKDTYSILVRGFDDEFFAASDKKIRAFKLGQNKPWLELEVSTHRITAAYYTTSGFLLIGNNNGFVAAWDIHSRTCVFNGKVHASEIKSILYDAKTNWVVCGVGKEVQFLDANRFFKSIRTIILPFSVNLMELCADHLVLGLANGTIMVINIANGKQLRLISAHSTGICVLKRISDDCIISSELKPNTSLVRTNIFSGVMEKIPQDPSGPVGQFDSVRQIISLGLGDLIATASSDNKIRIRSLNTGRVVHAFSDHTKEISGLIGVSGSLVSSSENGITRIYPFEEEVLNLQEFSRARNFEIILVGRLIKIKAQDLSLLDKCKNFINQIFGPALISDLTNGELSFSFIDTDFSTFNAVKTMLLSLRAFIINSTSWEVAKPKNDSKKPPVRLLAEHRNVLFNQERASSAVGFDQRSLSFNPQR